MDNTKTSFLRSVLVGLESGVTWGAMLSICFLFGRCFSSDSLNDFYYIFFIFFTCCILGVLEELIHLGLKRLKR